MKPPSRRYEADVSRGRCGGQLCGVVMIGLFEVMFCDPSEHAGRVDSTKVIAKHAEEAISRARKTLDKRVRHWQIESVTLIGWSDE